MCSSARGQRVHRNHLETFWEAGACAVPAEDLDSVPAPTLGSSQLQGTSALFWPPRAPTCTWYTQRL